jgi:hypothetical protein
MYRALPRLEAREAQTRMYLQLATNERRLDEAAVQALSDELDEAVAGERVQRGRGQKVSPMALTGGRVSLRPPDEATLARMRERQRKAKATGG